MKMKSSYGESESENSASLIGFGPFVRYYLPAGKMFPFVEAGAMFGQIKYKWDGTYSDGNEDKRGISGFNVGGGIGLPLGEKVVLDMVLGYQSMSFKDKEDKEDNDRTIIGTLGLKVGIVVFLGAN
jgi:opacity protein-like surface antigen